ncbi:DUF4293 domain-containing protein [Daejeonella oryzae]|uniref:DUF4293 domain-containing protein n=1 Tax=Daejeonella oryzae TaxID=1122943 RepID=UPI0004085510|nr:DUF4293 domain-containing protein [Daejeonella oryzae]
MLQRVQTIWLFFATLAIFCLFLFPYLQVLSANGTAKALKVSGVYENINGEIVQTQMFVPIMIATVILGLIPLVIIFFYKDRKKQINICYLCILAILGYSFWLVQIAKQVFGDITLQLGNYGIGVILPSLAILFIILALKGIRNDEKLIKSADRLR